MHIMVALLTTRTIAWVLRVFSTVTNLSTIPSTGEEIRRLVQAFLDARGRVIPKRRRQQRAAAEDSQESQDYFGEDPLDYNDPDLQIALGIDPYKEKEDVVSEVCSSLTSPVDVHHSLILCR